MNVFLTGATGFVGAHTARALLDAGHHVRFLVRNKEAAIKYFSAMGYAIDDFVVADMRDKNAVKAGMQGCDAVIHAAAIVDLNAKNALITQANNYDGMESVIGAACELGIAKILYVSSLSVLFNPGIAYVNEETPLANATDAYSKSKVMCEKRVRQYQEEGHPVIISYPSSVIGPDDPKLSESNSAFSQFFSSMLPQTSSGFQYVDARDLGIAHRLLLEKKLDKDLTRERYILGGHFSTWKEMGDLLEQSTGRKIRRVHVPGLLFRVIGNLFDLMRHIVHIEFPISREAMMLITQWTPCDSSRLQHVTGFTFRPAGITMKDTANWLEKEKHLKH